MQWIIDNKEWLFSGAGIFLITAIIALINKNKSSLKQSQKSGNNSTSYQSGGDMHIGGKNDKW